MTIAVTAMSGHLGSEIVGALLSATHETIVGLARTPENAKTVDIEVRPGDYDNRDELEKSLIGVDTLLLVSGMAAPEDRIQQHRNVINAASAAGVGKIVYTSIQGVEEGTAFSPIVQSSRQTEADIRASGLNWIIGRNGIYIEPDIEYIDSYKASGEIANCAGDAKCGYTTRPELGHAYASMATGSQHDGKVYNLHGEPISQARLAELLNGAFGTALTYRSMSVAAYREERVAELGEFIGTVIAGIYEGILLGVLDCKSDFEAATGRDHKSWTEIFAAIG